LASPTRPRYYFQLEGDIVWVDKNQGEGLIWNWRENSWATVLLPATDLCIGIATWISFPHVYRITDPQKIHMYTIPPLGPDSEEPIVYSWEATTIPIPLVQKGWYILPIEHILVRDWQPFPKRQETYIRYYCGDATMLLECKPREVDDGVDMAIIGSGCDRTQFLGPSLYAEFLPQQPSGQLENTEFNVAASSAVVRTTLAGDDEYSMAFWIDSLMRAGPFFCTASGTYFACEPYYDAIGLGIYTFD